MTVLASKSLHESFLNYHGPGKWEQELRESWLEIINEFQKYVM
jgi:hypothetical protein